MTNLNKKQKELLRLFRDILSVNEIDIDINSNGILLWGPYASVNLDWISTQSDYGSDRELSFGISEEVIKHDKVYRTYKEKVIQE